jgi:uncharacterized protein YndB with AHSA1/START domain
MPGFTLTQVVAAPVEEVWKVLFDPTRIPDWWVGMEAVRVDGRDAFTLWLAQDPGRPLPQRVSGEPAAGRMTMSCQVNEIDFTWRLAEEAGGTRVTVQVAFAPATADQLDRTRAALTASLPALAGLAEATG